MKKNISIVIPSYKTPYEIICRTIKSCLAQSYQPFEIIVIDDNGCNEFSEISKKIASEYTEKINVLLNDENRGANFSRNRGVNAAKGEYIAFLDSDDEWSNDYLEKVVNIIDREKAVFVTSNYQVVHKDGVLPPEFDKEMFKSGDISKKELYQDVVGPTSTVVIAKDLIIKAGLFDESLPARQDYDMWLRVTKLAPIHYNYDPCVKVFRVGADSISSSYKRNVEGTKMVLEKILSDKNLKNTEKRDISAAHYKHMALACILCNAYRESRVYAKKSLKMGFDKVLLVWLLLSYCPYLFSKLRFLRKKALYRKKVCKEVV